MLHFCALTSLSQPDLALRRKCILGQAVTTRSAKNLDLAHSFSWPLRNDSVTQGWGHSMSADFDSQQWH